MTADRAAAEPSEVNLDAYCVRCDSDKYTELRSHPTMLWCTLCWDWQTPIPTRIRAYIDSLRGE